ncbi:serine/threonine-protein kinase Nek5-like [Daphnia carinata]|uniref:serine/threonine-protein kinase Nek5-like n=1 Tax=Daphnia carinata TaxID=120202 RepID=UPI00257F3BFF|nr:serine/threonine-protein kinase Nek5-like [Daphnia carinata]
MALNYIKERVLGRGSFGTVYLIKMKTTDTHGFRVDGARDFKTEHGAASYVLKEICIRDEKQREAARQEGRLLSQLNHVNIIRYFDSFESPITGNLCLVMEYCPGGDVAAVIRQRRGVPFPEQQILSWFQQLVSALDYLHKRKILHRDIKTGNIFVTANLLVLKLGDFGVAKVLERTGQMARTCVGTPGYLSPEICGNRQYNSKSDIWSLGCVLYQLMTLRPPFTGRNMNQLLIAIVRGHFPPMPARYSYELRQTVATMLRKNPEERPSAEALLRKRLFSSKQAHQSSTKRKVSSSPSNRKGLLSVYANPLLSRPAKSTFVKGKNQTVKTKKDPRRRWNPPTQTLIGALSSLTVTDEATFILNDSSRWSLDHLSENTYEESDESQRSVDSDIVGNQQTTIMRETDESPFHRLERWIVSLEAVHGVALLKDVSSRLANAAVTAVEDVVRDRLFNKVSSSSVNELVDFFVFQRRLYLNDHSF